MKLNRGPLLVFLGSALWGTDGPIRSRLTTSVATPVILFWEHLFASLISAPLLFKKRHVFRRLDLGDWLSLAFIVVFGGVVATYAITEAFRLAFTSGNINVPILMQKLQPIFAIILAHFLLKEKIRPLFWIFAPIALVGGYILSFGFSSPQVALHDASSVVAVYALAAAIIWGSSTVLGKRLVDRYGFMWTTAARLNLGLVAMIVFLVITMSQPFILARSELLSLIYIGAITGFLALFIYYIGMRTTHAHVTTLAELGFPVMAVLVNWLWLEQGLLAHHIIGAVLIFGSVIAFSIIDGDRL